MGILYFFEKVFVWEGEILNVVKGCSLGWFGSVLV